MKTLLKYLKCPKYILLRLDNLGLIRISDKLYVELKFREMMGYKLDLNNPKTFNEKLNWLKLYDRKDIYTTMVDKYEVKEYVSNILGSEHIIPTLGVYDKFDDIDFDKLPNRFVMKCTHDSGGIVIVDDKESFDKEKAKKKLNSCLKKNFFYEAREWPYKNVKPRIIVEEYIEDKDSKDLKDYKFFCFNGKFRLLFIASDRNASTETCFDFYDEDLKHLPFTNGHPMSSKKIVLPKNIKKMIEYAEKLSKDIIQARIDFYDVNGKIYFGEITFFHWGGLIPFEPKEWDRKFGDMIDISKASENKDEK